MRLFKMILKERSTDLFYGPSKYAEGIELR